MSEWISVKDKLPEIDVVVMVCIRCENGDARYTWGGRTDDGEGWLWGVVDCSWVDPAPDSRWNDIVVDDDYAVKFWKPMDQPPAFEETDGKPA